MLRTGYRSIGFLLWGVPTGVLAAGNPVPPIRGPEPNTYRYASQLLPDIVSIVNTTSLAGVLAGRAPRYVAIAFGKEEYVYSLADQKFIRCIKERYELPPWRVCGDFALVRVELMGASMETVTPVMAWSMIFRENRWQRLIRDEEDRFWRSNFENADLPPYARHCFGLDPGDKTFPAK